MVCSIVPWFAVGYSEAIHAAKGESRDQLSTITKRI